MLQQNPTASPGQPAISHVDSREQRRRQIGLPIEPHEFLVSGEVAHRRIVRRIIPRHEDPADMGVEKATLHRRMHVDGGVRVSVVLTVLGGPPQGAALGGGLCQERQAELKDARRCERRDGRSSDGSLHRSRRSAPGTARPPARVRAT